MTHFLNDPAAIYAESLRILRAEARLDRFAPEAAPLVERVIHACGMVDIADDLVAAPDCVTAGRRALAQGAPILCDCRMTAQGIIARALPEGADVIVTLDDARVPGLAASRGSTRSAAAVSLWTPRLEGAVVAIGNAPTALFELLALLEAGAPRPAVILGFPVGFVGAAESKARLAQSGGFGAPFATLLGRRGGSAMAAAAVNALLLGAIGDGISREGTAEQERLCATRPNPQRDAETAEAPLDAPAVVSL